MIMTRLTAKGLKEWRESRLAANGGRCALCRGPCVSPVADHDHNTGELRDTICRSCNSGLGAVERAQVRFGIRNLAAFLHGTVTYLQKHSQPQHGLQYPTHRTDEEKRIARNAKARKARATKKESA